ncbi:MAG: PEGA domain-containing protein [Bacteroidaceae bacterium]|nr:PEGA domain-containing protein [Bacteroidaceae bacterium]
MNIVRKKFLFVLLALFFSLHINGQDVSVSSFKLIENDLTANTTGTMERDQNGETAALIKVVTPETGFSFDGGMVGIVKTRQEVGEVWVYVPHGIKKMSIRHPQLGVLRDYYFPISIEKARTYEMVITTGKVQTFVSQSLNKQFVIFTVKPQNSVVEFNGEIIELDETGYAEISMPYGVYSYRISSPNYHTTAGNLEVKDGGKPEINVELTPNFGWLEVNAIPEYHGATVYVDGKKIGTAPFDKIQMKSGVYKLKIEQKLYKDYEAQIEVKDGQIYLFELSEMIPDFANVELVVDEKSEIWVDGEMKGIGKWNGPLEIGDHSVETKQVSHIPSTETIHIIDAEPRSIQLKHPVPLYSSMEITSSPSRAKVFIDSVEVGMTPLILNEVLVGTREVAFEKDGYDRHVKYVNVDYGVNSSVKAILTDPSDEPLAKIATTPTESVQDTIEEKGIILHVKHPSDYQLYINEIYEDDFSGNQYDLGSLKAGKYKIAVKGKKYSRHKRFKINDETSELYLKTKTKKNYFHSNLSIYAGATYSEKFLYDDFYIADSHGGISLYGFKLGGYIKNINIEYNYLLGEFDDTRIDYRIGYGFKAGRSFLITPQIAYCKWKYIEEVLADKDGIYWSEGGHYKVDEEFSEDDFSLGCRVQYCLTKIASLAVTPLYTIGEDNLDVEFNVIFTLPFTRK